MSFTTNAASNSHSDAHLSSSDRVRNHTAEQVNRTLDQQMTKRIQHYSRQPDAIAQRIEELEREWDTERVLEANASLLAFTGLMLGLWVHANWFWLPGIVLPFLFQHAIQDWCPPLPIIRRLGVRTQREIDREKYALKMLRGDFANLVSSNEDSATRAAAVLDAIQLYRI
ncbi:MAG: hypothetical protein MUC48_25480 [Leptolyngbya sp. Prado105]|jgi:hypothetical protein|nr:hypothetical protein [Leptolyngbya sp. Prado105]